MGGVTVLARGPLLVSGLREAAAALLAGAHPVLTQWRPASQLCGWTQAVTADAPLPGGRSRASTGRAQRVPFSSWSERLREPSTRKPGRWRGCRLLPLLKELARVHLQGLAQRMAGAAWGPSCCPGLPAAPQRAPGCATGLSCHPL